MPEWVIKSVCILHLIIFPNGTMVKWLAVYGFNKSYQTWNNLSNGNVRYIPVDNLVCFLSFQRETRRRLDIQQSVTSSLSKCHVHMQKWSLTTRSEIL